MHGWLFTSVDNEDRISSEGAGYLEEALQHAEATMRMGRDNINYAREHFSLATFESRWHALLDQVNKEELS